MITEYSKAMRDIRNRVIKENIKTTPLKQDYIFGGFDENGNIIIIGRIGHWSDK